MEESVSGFTQEGEWVTIVEHGERITAALADVGVDDEEVADWNEWRPKAHERLSEAVTEKTAEQASTARGNGERADTSPDEDITSAGEELTEATKDVAEGEFEGAIDNGNDAVTYTARAVDSAGRKAIRAAEEPVYKHVMPQVSPCYFDNALISANLSRTQDDESQYAFEVNITDDTLKEHVSEQLAAYDAEIGHWRIETEKNTASIEAAEGVEPSE